MNTNLKALIIEDSAEDAQLLVHELNEGGYQVTPHRVETEEALRLALAGQTWDICFCDFTMPRFSGKAALEIIKASGFDLPFIYVSGTIGEDVAVEAMKSGAHDYVMKNNLTRLAPAVERELREARLRREHRILEADRERLVVELSAALMDVKRLSGLLPICASCKKIRNDRNEWQPIEVFIRDHSEAQFSHGLCPGCLARLYEFPGDEDKLRD
jgi:DNA-binding NtrC family response regulator